MALNIELLEQSFEQVAVFSQLRQGIHTNFGTPVSLNFGRVFSSTSAGVNT